jgi:hypothetical protein
MSYAFQADNTHAVLAKNELSNEPFEFFPPDAADMDDRGRFLAAFRIVRRLSSKWVKPDQRDIAIVTNFLEKSAELDPDNAYWLQFFAAVKGLTGDPIGGLDAWLLATERDRWETGETQALQLLWRDLATADRRRLAWQGVVALENASEGPGDFIVENVSGIAYSSIQARATSLANAAIILDSTRSFSTSSAAIRLANLAVFGKVDPIGALGQRRYEETKTAFPRLVSNELDQSSADRAVGDQQTIESWSAFYRTGAPIARATLRRLHTETLLTSSLPSAVCVASLLLAGIGLIGQLFVYLLGPVLNPDRRFVLITGLLAASLCWWATGIFLIGLWVLTITGLLCVPQLVSRDERPKWRLSERFVITAIALMGLLFLSANFVLRSTPAMHLDVHPQSADLGLVAGLTLSLSLPCAAVWARLRKLSLFRATGETLSYIGLVGTIVGFAATIIVTPLSIWRDSVDRTLIEQWIRSEPATFRPDAPQ